MIGLWPRLPSPAIIANATAMRAIVQSNTPVTLLGGGDCAPETLDRALARAPRLVAADGGADRALALGRVPEAVIGDIDSLSQEAQARLGPERVYRVPDQDSTDFDKALAGIIAPLILAVGFTGARLDHTLATFSTLARNPARRCLVLGGGDLCFLAPPSLRLELRVGARLSLFPMAPVRGRSEGMRWPIGGVAFAPWGVIGTSNEVVQPRVGLSFDAPGMLVVLGAAELDAVMAALAEAPRWSPVGVESGRASR